MHAAVIAEAAKPVPLFRTTFALSISSCRQGHSPAGQLLISNLSRDCQVYINGEKTAQESAARPTVVSLAPGRHTLRLETDTEFHEKEVNISPGREVEFAVQEDVKWKPILVAVEILTTPDGAELIIDDNQKAIAPARIELRVGNHSVTASKNGNIFDPALGRETDRWRSKTEPISVVKGRNKRFTMNLDEWEPGVIADMELPVPMTGYWTYKKEREPGAFFTVVEKEVRDQYISTPDLDALRSHLRQDGASNSEIDRVLDFVRRTNPNKVTYKTVTRKGAWK